MSKRTKNETLLGGLMVFLGIVIMLIALTLGVILPTNTLEQVQSNMVLVGTFLTPPFFTIGGMILIILGKMHADSEKIRAAAEPATPRNSPSSLQIFTTPAKP